MILGISGRKQAGKNTTANILHGIVLKEQGFIKDWNLGSRGQLLIPSDGGSGWGEFWVERKDEQFVSWADNNMWPYVKLYSFADNLKAICMELFNIPFRCLYGTDEEKNQLQEHLLWENICDDPLLWCRSFMGTQLGRRASWRAVSYKLSCLAG